MAQTGVIDVPGAGPVPKGWVYVGLAGVAAVVGYAYWKRRNSSSSPEIVEPEIEDYTGGVQTGGAGVTQPGLPYSTGESSGAVGAPHTNAEWTQAAITALEGVGFDPQFAAVTLGKYLAAQPLNAAEADLVRTAQGLVGRPPVGDVRIIMIGTNSTPAPSTPPTAPERVSVPLNYNLYQWTAEIAAAYGIPYDLNRLRTLNPGIDSYIKWLPPAAGTDYKIPVFYKATPQVRIR